MDLSDIDEFVDQFELSKRSQKISTILRNERSKNYFLLNREKKLAAHKRWREKNKEWYYQKYKDYWAHRYSSQAQYERIHAFKDHEKVISKYLQEQIERGMLLPKECCRGTLTPTKVSRVLFEIMNKRIEEYQNPMETNEKKKIMCIVGDSGTGKTLASLHLKYKLGANVICSFTNRPPRPTEVEGRDHHFVDIMPDEIDTLALTVYGEYTYYALKSQVFGDCTVYVIDEEGIRDLMDVNGDDYRIFTVYLMRDEKLRRGSKVKKNRMNRDKERKRFPISFYDYVIENNGKKAHLFGEIERIYNTIKNLK